MNIASTFPEALSAAPAAVTSANLAAACDAAVRTIPPLWPLASSVAVNPYLGQSGECLATTGTRLARVAGLPMTMPRAWFAAKITEGTITEADLAAALTACTLNPRPAAVAGLIAAARGEATPPKAVPHVADLAASASGRNWPGLIAERIGTWAASHFDEGQALWAAPKGRSAYAAWRAFAIHDLTPEIAGLRGFCTFVADAPDDADAAIARAVARLGLGQASPRPPIERQAGEHQSDA